MSHKKIVYIFSCFLLILVVSGCKGIGGKITVFNGLEDSPYLTEAKKSLEDKKPLVVTFIAEWCPHCRKYKPTFLEVKEELKEKVTFINVDVDDVSGSALQNRFQVRGIPTTAFIRSDGSVFKVQVGGIEKDSLISTVEELVKSKKKKRGEPVAPFPIENLPEEPKPEEEQPPQELIKEEPERIQAKPVRVPPAEELKEKPPEETQVEPMPTPQAEQTQEEVKDTSGGESESSEENMEDTSNPEESESSDSPSE